MGIMPVVDAFFEFVLIRAKQFRDIRRLTKPGLREEV